MIEDYDEYIPEEFFFINDEGKFVRSTGNDDEDEEL